MPDFSAALAKARKKYTQPYLISKGRSGIYGLFRWILLFGLAFVICFPFIVKLSASFMSKSDLYDSMVKFIPRNPTLENYTYVAEYTDYFGALFNTAWISTLYALLQVLCCALVGYGLAKFRFRGKGVLFALVIFTMIIPPQATVNALYMNFRYFNPLGIFGLFSKQLPNLVDSPYPMILLSSCGLALKNGLYIVLMRQFYKGVPDEMIEAAEVDGAGAVRTFVRIIFPMTTPMLVTIFLLAFSWQWTDVYYSGLLFQDFNVLSNIVMRVGQIGGEGYQGSKMSSVLINTASIMVITPLLILYLFAQKKLIQGIERTGLVG